MVDIKVFAHGITKIYPCNHMVGMVYLKYVYHGLPYMVFLLLK